MSLPVPLFPIASASSREIDGDVETKTRTNERELHFAPPTRSISHFCSKLFYIAHIHLPSMPFLAQDSKFFWRLRNDFSWEELQTRNCMDLRIMFCLAYYNLTNLPSLNVWGIFPLLGAQSSPRLLFLSLPNRIDGLSAAFTKRDLFYFSLQPFSFPLLDDQSHERTNGASIVRRRRKDFSFLCIIVFKKHT